LKEEADVGREALDGTPDTADPTELLVGAPEMAQVHRIVTLSDEEGTGMAGRPWIVT
jgi:hypothetical protein